MVPSQGFLNAQSLQAEKLEPGDTLRYQATAVLPLVGLALEAATPAPAWMIEPAWQLRLAADALSRSARYQDRPVRTIRNWASRTDFDSERFGIEGRGPARMVRSSAVNGVSAWLTQRLVPAGTRASKQAFKPTRVPIMNRALQR